MSELIQGSWQFVILLLLLVFCSCEGRCMRSFHAAIGTGINSLCKTLGFIDDAQVEVLTTLLIPVMFPLCDLTSRGLVSLEHMNPCRLFPDSFVTIVSIKCTNALLVESWVLLTELWVQRYASCGLLITSDLNSLEHD